MRIQKLHPIAKFRSRPKWIMLRRREQLGHVCQSHGGDLARSLGKEPALGIVRYLKQPGAKQFVIPKLSGLSVNRKHDFLGQVFGRSLFMPTPAKERNQPRREYTEQAIERIFVWPIEKPLSHFPLLKTRH
jgi:hypothetical protein